MEKCYIAEHDPGSVRKEDGPIEVCHSLLKRKLAFGSDTNNHPGRGNAGVKTLRHK